MKKSYFPAFSHLITYKVDKFNRLSQQKIIPSKVSLSLWDKISKRFKNANKSKIFKKKIPLYIYFVYIIYPKNNKISHFNEEKISAAHKFWTGLKFRPRIMIKTIFLTRIKSDLIKDVSIKFWVTSSPLCNGPQLAADNQDYGFQYSILPFHRVRIFQLTVQGVRFIIIFKIWYLQLPALISFKTTCKI